MNKLNPCVTGDTKVWTVEGLKTFKELAETNDDVNVYCLDGDGNIKVSKMFHPRVSGYNVELVKITLTDGTVLKATVNHMFLTDDGYAMAGDLFDGYKIVTINKNNVILPSDIDEEDKQFTEYTGTKKGTVIKKCEVSGEEFECIWDEREICTREGYEADLYNIKLQKVCTSSDNYEYKTVEDVEFLGREDVYNGTVAIYHNYFTVDENTNTIVNQLNCGE
jgi:intein/homing endonuclease